MSYTDIYLSGPPEVIADTMALNSAAPAMTPSRILDGVAYVLIRTLEGAPPALPKGVALEDLTRFPETARMAVGVFVPDPDPA